MTKYKELKLIDNKKLVVWLNIASFILIFPFGFLFSFIASSIGQTLGGQVTLISLFLWLVAYFLLIFVHELVHGLFFKIFCPQGKVKFGFKNRLAYATSPGNLYPKGQFYVIILAPFVVISTLLTIVFALGWLPGLGYVIIASMHAASCVGDFYWTYLISKEPKGIKVEDTEAGMNFHK